MIGPSQSKAEKNTKHVFNHNYEIKGTLIDAMEHEGTRGDARGRQTTIENNALVLPHFTSTPSNQKMSTLLLRPYAQTVFKHM